MFRYFDEKKMMEGWEIISGALYDTMSGVMQKWGSRSGETSTKRDIVKMKQHLDDMRATLRENTEKAEQAEAELIAQREECERLRQIIQYNSVLEASMIAPDTAIKTEGLTSSPKESELDISLSTHSVFNQPRNIMMPSVITNDLITTACLESEALANEQSDVNEQLAQINQGVDSLNEELHTLLRLEQHKKKM